MKINTTRMIAILGSLCLVTSSFVGSTLAKYTTQVSGNDTARVAKFGVELTADSNLFKQSYDETGSITVLSDDADDDATRNGRVIAPGTSGVATLFTIDGAPEVTVDVKVSLSDPTALTMATLPAGTYNDYTTLVDSDNDGDVDANDVMTTFTLTEDYKPVKWTLKHDDTTVLYNVNLDAIETYFAGISKVYNVEDNSFDAINGDYELSWTWAYEGVNDAADTYMGQIAAGDVTAPAGYVANESFNFILNVTQVD